MTLRSCVCCEVSDQSRASPAQVAIVTLARVRRGDVERVIELMCPEHRRLFRAFVEHLSNSGRQAPLPPMQRR
jgi:hypothetical protein